MSTYATLGTNVTANGICLVQAPPAGAFSLNGALVTNYKIGKRADIEYASKLTLTSAGNLSTVSFTIKGEDYTGNVIEEVIAGPNATTVNTVDFFKNVTKKFAGDLRDYPEPTYVLANIEIPAAVNTPVYAYSLDDVLARQAHPKVASDYLDALYRRLTKICSGLETEIVVELHTRLAFGVSCVVLVVFGAALGIVLRSGHLLSAFGVSCIPAVLCLTTIFTGKHIAEESGASMTWGILFLWSGIVAVTLADGWIFRNLLKR